MSLLEINNLSTHFNTDAGLIKAVDDVSLKIDNGEVVAIVGGSGSGKTVLALSILGLVPEPGRIVGGEILYKGKDLTKISKEELMSVRGRGISMIFQEPMTALNPVFTIGDQIEEAILVHSSKSCHSRTRSNRSGINSSGNLANPLEPRFLTSGGQVCEDDRRGRAIELLKLVGIPDPAGRLDCYPHELSGGMRQRVMIAMALACNPDILIADEPTTALDVTIQAQVLDLLGDLQRRLKMAVIFITHDFGIVAQIADRVCVMHEGRIVETGSVDDIFAMPNDEYTKRLLAAVPVL